MFFKRKEKKEEEKRKKGVELICKLNVNDLLIKIAKEALKELKEEKEKNKDLENNLEVLINTNEKIKELCKKNNSKLATTILKELGE